VRRASLNRKPPESRQRAREGRTRATGTATGQPKPPSGFTPKVKLQIRTRAGGGDPAQARCEATGVFLGEHGGEYQHIVARGMGGTSDPVKNSAANGCLLSPEAHRIAEARDPHMREMGFWLPQGTDPRAEPMMLHGTGPLVWRSEDGEYLFAPPQEVAA